MGYLFEWDPRKAFVNERKHGIAFDEATTVFGDPLALLVSDPDHSIEELRYLLLGMSNRQRLLIICYAERPPRTRLISARLATKQERAKYEEGD
ncbi:MAG: BrnT family toxin [Candidatus Sumerlaeota bacterium]|nr:BrnT family toxin [Candidatus Sumerlaeota bacterium]